MATIKRIKPKKPVDHVAYAPVSCALSKAKAMAWVLEQVGPGHNLENALEDGPEETHAWLHDVGGDALRAALDDIEREHRKLRDVIASATTPAEIIRLVEGYREPKDGGA